MSGDLALELPLGGTQLIEASAGTGKTWTIAGLYLRAIVERRLPVRDILVVTFTRAATEDLKDRLRDRLSKFADLAERLLRGEACDPAATGEAAFAQALLARACSGEPLHDIARRLRLADESMDEATILTIHGWCQRVLREHAFDSGEPLDAGELVGSDQDLLAQVAADFWRSHASDVARGDAFALMRERLDSPQELADVLARTREPDLCVWPRADETAATAEAALRLAVDECRRTAAGVVAAWRTVGENDLDVVLAHARAGDLNQQSYKPARIEAARERCGECLRVGHLPARATLEGLSRARLRAKTNKGRRPLPDLAFPAAIDDWLAADNVLVAARTAYWPVLLAQARAHGRRELDRRKQAAMRQSYDDLVARVHAAIVDPARGERLAMALHARHPLVLVDEFQDTDARQYAIFRRMQDAGDDGALVLVGDPKQAIYRFRGGDIEAYLAAAEGASVHRLGRNFRSSPALLGAIEAVFGAAGPGNAFADPRIRFHPVEAGGRAADDDVLVDGKALVPLTAWHLPDDMEANKHDGCALLAAGCAEAVLRLLQKGNAGDASVRGKDGRQPLQAHHVAVLVATNREAAIMQDALAARGIASATIRQQSVFGTDEARDLHVFLDALVSRDEPTLRAALSTRLFGFDARHMAELSDPAHALRWQRELGRLDDLHRRWQQHGVLAMFERVFETQAATLLDSAGGERRLTNYLQLADLLQHAAAGRFGASGLVEWLRRRIALADDQNEEEQLRLESDADRVQIATIHASKGLEYDLVFLPFTALAPARHERRPCVMEWHAAGVRQAWVHTSKEEEAPAGAREGSEREELAERVRVLYVALTRARYGCWLSWDAIGKPACVAALAQLWHGGDRQPSRADTRAALGRLAGAAGGRVQVECLPDAGANRLAPVAATALPPARAFAARIDGSWWISSFSQLRDGRRSALPDESGADDEAGGAAVDTIDEPDLPADGAIADWPRGERFGTAMHEILEHADFAAWDGHVDTMPPLAARDRLVACLRRHLSEAHGREAELQRVATRLAAAALNARLPGGIHLAELEPSARRAEMPFHFAIGGAEPARLIALLREHGYQRQRTDFTRLPGQLAGLMTGVIDLVYRHDGRWWIVDWKTNHLGTQRADYAPDALAAAVREHDYDLQYVIYTLALHRWLRLRVRDYDYDRDIGGAIYLFLRGLERDGSHGVHVDRPPRALVEAMDILLAPGARA